MFIVVTRALKCLGLALCLPAFAVAQLTQSPIKMALIEVLRGSLVNTGEAV